MYFIAVRIIQNLILSQLLNQVFKKDSFCHFLLLSKYIHFKNYLNLNILFDFINFLYDAFLIIKHLSILGAHNK